MTTAPRTVIARDAARRSPHHAAAASWTSVALSVLAYGCESLGHAGPWTSLDRRAQRSMVDCEGAPTRASSYLRLSNTYQQEMADVRWRGLASALA